MSRTRRNAPYKHYWGHSKAETKIKYEESKGDNGWSSNYWERAYRLYGTDTMNLSYPTHYYFNRVNRIGRRVARDQLRPHIVLGADFDFDDSHYRARYKGVWWDIY